MHTTKEREQNVLLVGQSSILLRTGLFLGYEVGLVTLDQQTDEYNYGPKNEEKPNNENHPPNIGKETPASPPLDASPPPRRRRWWPCSAAQPHRQISHLTTFQFHFFHPYRHGSHRWLQDRLLGRPPVYPLQGCARAYNLPNILFLIDLVEV